MVSRRALMLAAGALASTRALAQVQYPSVVPRQLVFPRDHGAHPEYRTEWWYMTGWLDGAPSPIGFQITFFRTRTTIDAANPSPFAAKQLVIAHAAIADPARGTLLHDERVARTGFGAASVSDEDTDVLLDRWRFQRFPQGSYSGAITARGFTLQLDAEPTQPLLLQGEAGYSRKGSLATASQLLLLTATARGARVHHARRETRGAHRPWLARSRMVKRGARRRRGRMGLDRHELGRRQCADRVLDSQSAIKFCASVCLRFASSARRKRTNLRAE